MTKELEDVGKLVGVTAKIVDLAAESPELKDAGRTLAKSSLTLAKAINNCLLPIAAVNFAFDKAREYFQGKFQKDLGKMTEAIPPENLIEPKASVAAPALQGLAFSHEEPDLKTMYLKLLSTAMDGRKAHKAHPAYAEIIRQLTSDEARILNDILYPGSPIPIVSLNERSSVGIRTIHKHVVQFVHLKTGSQMVNPELPAMIDNWQRLGLIAVTYQHHLVAEESYDWVKSRPEYIELEKKIKEKAEVEKGILNLTAFGRSFAEAISSKPQP